jgi:hypothetical protein
MDGDIYTCAVSHGLVTLNRALAYEPWRLRSLAVTSSDEPE